MNIDKFKPVVMTNSELKKLNLVHYTTAVDKGKEKIDNARKGIKNFYELRWKKLNIALGEGIEFGTTTTIGARSGVGKSTFVNLITNDIFELNEDVPTILLYWNFEVPSYKQILKKISENARSSVKDLIKRKEVLFDNIDEEINKLREKYKDKHFYFIDTSVDYNNILKVNTELHTSDKYKNFRVVNILDHTRLVRGDDYNEEQKLTNLYKVFMYMANNYSSTNISISQLNKAYQNELDKKGYKAPGIGDIFGSDGIIQSSDTVLLLHRPEQNNTSRYSYNSLKDNGEEYEYIKEEDTKDRLYIEIVKQRNGMLGSISLKHDLRFNKIYE
jgi:replicative DNA helicase